jgi:hypothetical protein
VAALVAEVVAALEEAILEEMEVVGAFLRFPSLTFVVTFYRRTRSFSHLHACHFCRSGGGGR